MLDARGYEIPDNTPVSIPSRLRMPKSRAEQIRAFIRQELSQKAADDGHETFEEADDFSLPDGQEWLSPYENDFDPVIPESGLPGDQAPAPGEGAEPPAKPVTETPNVEEQK